MDIVKEIVKEAHANLPKHPKIRILKVFSGYIYYDVTKRGVNRGQATGLIKYNKNYLGQYSTITNQYCKF